MSCNSTSLASLINGVEDVEGEVLSLNLLTSLTFCHCHLALFTFFIDFGHFFFETRISYYFIYPSHLLTAPIFHYCFRFLLFLWTMGPPNSPSSSELLFWLSYDSPQTHFQLKQRLVVPFSVGRFEDFVILISYFHSLRSSNSSTISASLWVFFDR